MDIPKTNNGNLPIVNLSSSLIFFIRKNKFLNIFNIDNMKKNKYMLLSISISN